MSNDSKIIPTVGRVVWYHPAPKEGSSDFAQHYQPGAPYAAIVAYVCSEALVNLAVFDANGTPRSRSSVALIQEGDAAPRDAEYCEWMPFQKGQARAQAAPVSTNGLMSFGAALNVLKAGGRVARVGWNGKGMWLYLNLGSHDKAEQHALIDGVPRALFSLGHEGTATRLPNINMQAASGATVTGWLASQTDMLAEDWMVVA